MHAPKDVFARNSIELLSEGGLDTMPLKELFVVELGEAATFIPEYAGLDEVAPRQFGFFELHGYLPTSKKASKQLAV